MHNINFKKLMVLGMTASLLAGCEVADQSQEDGGNETGNVNEEGDVAVSEVNVDASSGVTDAVSTIDDAVVSVINMQQAAENPYGWYGSTQDGEETEDEESLQQVGTGSGAVYKVDGDTAYVFTNNHVIEGSDAVDVLLKDGTRVQAEVIGADVWTDLAVLTIDSEDVSSVAEFGNSEELAVGEPAIAIGSPLGTDFASSVTSGIISAVERSVPVDTDGDGEYDWEMTAIQTDAAINPGNSGGPLVNIAGQVIGINSMKISTSTVEGMGFAIPSNDAVDIINQLEESGEITRPVLGIGMVDLAMISQQQQESVLNVPEDIAGGVVIAEVTSGSAAAEAELAQNDIIVKFNGVDVTNGIELRQQIYDTEIGDNVEVEYYRDGSLEKTTINMRASDQAL
ncbi:serine protease Do [Marinilactibacillus piezotolerans]|uniref:Serine protease Do n=1 Tax=Marinilactibacillus piezotolerans TaxID=258723 RepID=A0A1I3XN98_9LACT|nr:trypsin-like peptidase domain-containing protein [Marinilactibacillus piezotolerans]SFK20521.1 serine protease Do [Marinilactibacillus piezotolerans]